MTDDALAKGIIEKLGGRENIEAAINCMTRIRAVLKSDSAVQVDDLKALDGVLAVTNHENKYIEVVVGPGKARKCIDVFRANGIPGFAAGPIRTQDAGPDTGKKSVLKRLLKQFSQIFAPLIPGIVAAGICAGLASLIAQVVPGYTGSRTLSVIYNLLSGINAAFMTYLTAWAGYRAAEVFGGTPILGGMIGMFMTLDQVDAISKVIGLYDEAQPLNAILRSGRGGVLAAIIGVWLMCMLEKELSKRMPDALNVVFTPMLTLLATLIPYVLIVMPALGVLSAGLCRLVGVVALSEHPAVRMAAGFLGAALFLPMVATGTHHGLIALYTVQLETFGYVTLYPALAMAGAGQVGAAISIALKAKKAGNSRLCKVINSAMPAAVLGVGEPLIYSVTMPMGRPFITAGLGAGAGGAFVMLMRVASTTWGPSGLLGAFVMTEGPNGAVPSIGCYLIGWVISCCTAYLITSLTLPKESVALQ